MFKSKTTTTIETLKFDLEVLERALKLHKESYERYKEWHKDIACNVCGCVVSNPIKGKGEIRQRDTEVRTGVLTYKNVPEDYIHYSYYCKIHKPKK